MGRQNKRWQFAENKQGKVTEEVNQWNTGTEKMWKIFGQGTEQDEMTAPCARGIGKKSYEGRKVLRVVTNQGNVVWK